MQNRNAGSRFCFERIENGTGCTPRMETYHLPACASAGFQDAREGLPLEIPAPFVRRTAIKPDFSHVVRLSKKMLPQRNFGMPISNQFGVEPEARLNPSPRADDLPIAFPSLGRGRYRENVNPALLRFRQDGSRIGVEIDVAVEINQNAPSAVKNVSSSARPRSATPCSAAVGPSCAEFKLPPAQLLKPLFLRV